MNDIKNLEVQFPTIQQQIEYWNKKEGEELERVSRIQEADSRDATNETRVVTRLANALTECRDILCALTTSDSAIKLAYMLPKDIPAAIKHGYSALMEYKEAK